MSRRLIHLDVSAQGLLVVAGILVGLWLLLLLRPLVLLLVIAAMFATAVSPAVEWLARHHVPRSLAVILLVLALIAVVGGFAVLVGPVIVRQGQALADKLPQLRQDVARFVDQHGSHELAQKVQSFSPGQLQGSGSLAPILSAGRLVVSGITAVVMVVVVAAYMAYDSPRIRRFIDFSTPEGWHEHVHHILEGLQRVVGGYIRGQLITSVLAMLVGFILFTALRVPNAVALAVFGGFADVVPIIGIYLWTIPSGVAALSVSLVTAIVVVVALVLYQELESRLLVQRIYGQTLRLPAVVVVVALLVGAELQGMVGALLALPAAAAIRVLVEYGDEVRQRRKRAALLRVDGRTADAQSEPRAASSV